MEVRIEKEKARSRGNCNRAQSNEMSIAQAYRWAGVILGVAFGLMFFIALIGG